MEHKRKYIYGGLVALALVGIMGAGGFPSRPKFQSLSVISGTAATGTAVDVCSTQAAAGNDCSRLRVNETGDLRLEFMNDARTSISAQPLLIERTGATVDSMTVNADLTTFNGNHAAAGTVPQVFLHETDAAVDNRWWVSVAAGEMLRFGAENDAHSVTTNWLEVDRTGTTVDAVRFAATEVTIGDQPLNVFKALKGGDTSRTFLTTNTADPTLALSLPVGAWAITGWIWFAEASDGPGFKHGLSFSGGTATGFYVHQGTNNAANTIATPLPLGSGVAFANPQNGNCTVAGGDWLAIHGTANVTAAGTLQFVWSQNSSSGTNTTVCKHSWIQAEKM